MQLEQRYYENPELWADERYGAADRERVAAAAERIPPGTRSLLDVGCGNGLFLNFLQKAVAAGTFDRLCGMDRSHAALDGVGVEKCAADITNLPFADAEFDVVTCMEVIEHLPYDSLVRALGELARVARRSVMITVPYREDLESAHVECPACRCRFHRYYHMRAFDERAIAGLMDAQGCSCREVFHLRREKRMPPLLLRGISALATLRRRALGLDVPPLAAGCICPLCGWQGATASSGPAVPDVSGRAPPRRRRAMRWLNMSRSWHWIGGLYDVKRGEELPPCVL